jgi:hypothetical protein
MPEGLRCDLCRWWGWDGNRQSGMDHLSADCRRNAPIFHEVRDGGYIREQNWPQTKGKDWCGDFEQIPQRYSDMPTAKSRVLPDGRVEIDTR